MCILFLLTEPGTASQGTMSQEMLPLTENATLLLRKIKRNFTLASWRQPTAVWKTTFESGTLLGCHPMDVCGCRCREHLMAASFWIIFMQFWEVVAYCHQTQTFVLWIGQWWALGDVHKGKSQWTFENPSHWGHSHDNGNGTFCPSLQVCHISKVCCIHNDRLGPHSLTEEEEDVNSSKWKPIAHHLPCHAFHHDKLCSLQQCKEEKPKLHWLSNCSPVDWGSHTPIFWWCWRDLINIHPFSNVEGTWFESNFIWHDEGLAENNWRVFNFVLFH